VGELSARLDENTVLLIISDHGFQSGGDAPKTISVDEAGDGFSEPSFDRVTVGQPGVHHADGILIASGGPVVPGEIEQTTLYDIAPTALALLGLPVPEDMPGRVIDEIVSEAHWEAHPIERIDSYESRIERAPTSAEGAQDEEWLQMLKALGYIE
jgi:arylsulfatase A-like enzyme